MKTPIRFVAAITLATAGSALALGPMAAQPPGPAAQDDASQDDAAQPLAEKLARAFAALEKEYDKAYANYRTELRAYSAAVRADRDAERPSEPQEAFMKRFVRLADAGSLDAQVWVLQNHSYMQIKRENAGADKRKRLASALEAGPSNEQLSLLGRVLSQEAMGRGVLEKKEALGFLDQIVEAASDPEVQATAASYRANAFDLREGSDEERQAGLAALKAVEARWPDTKAGKRAGGKAFAMENLNIGQTAPDIVGADVDGTPMKLSNFKGKVTVIDFWGFW